MQIPFTDFRKYTQDDFSPLSMFDMTLMDTFKSDTQNSQIDVRVLG